MLPPVELSSLKNLLNVLKVNILQADSVDQADGFLPGDDVQSINLEHLQDVSVFVVLDTLFHLSNGQSFLNRICEIASYHGGFLSFF
jgi:hypothetical protein